MTRARERRRTSATVEPLTNYGVLRAQQDLRGGEAGISVIATAVNRSLDDLTAQVSPSRRVHDRRDVPQSLRTAASTSSRGSSPARTSRERRQAICCSRRRAPCTTSSSRATTRDVDSTRTSLAGHSEQIKFGKYGGGVTRFETSLVAAVGRVRGERPRLPASRRHPRLEHVGRAVVQKRARHLQLGAGQRQPLGDSGTRRARVSRTRSTSTATWGSRTTGTSTWAARSASSRRATAIAARAAVRCFASRAASPRGAASTPTAARAGVVRDVDEPLVRRRGQLARRVVQSVRELPPVVASVRSTSGRTTRATTTIRSGSATSPTAPRATCTTASRISSSARCR